MTIEAELAASLRGAAGAPARSPGPREAPPPPAPESPPAHLAAAAAAPEGISAARLDLAASLPPKTALLKVVMARDDGKDAFQLEGYYSGRMMWASDPEDLRHQLKPGMTLARKLSGGASIDTAVDCYRFMLNWSLGKDGLKRWIADLRQALGTELRLIIWDETNFGIPWELLQLHPTGGKDTEWLGVAVQAIRWTTIRDPARFAQFSAEQVHRSEGRVLSYEDTGLPGNPKFGFAASGHPGIVPKGDMEALLAELADESKRYALVYVRAHGVHGDSLDASTLAGIRLSDFEGYALPALRESRAVVFLNACNSATAVIDTYYGNNLNRNFAEVFLRQHASAVIATLAEVPVGPSSALARRLLKEARGEGVNIPEFLQARRAAYFGDVLRTVHEAGIPVSTQNLTLEQKVAIQAFMYASVFTYFGHPQTILKLEAA